MGDGSSEDAEPRLMLSPTLTPLEITGPTTRVHIQGDLSLASTAACRGRDPMAGRPWHDGSVIGGATGVFRRRGFQTPVLGDLRDVRDVNAIYVPATRYTAPMQFV